MLDSAVSRAPRASDHSHKCEAVWQSEMLYNADKILIILFNTSTLSKNCSKPIEDTSKQRKHKEYLEEKIKTKKTCELL